MQLTNVRSEEIESLTTDLLRDSYSDKPIVPPINLNLLMFRAGLKIRFGNFQDPNIDGAFDRSQNVIFLSRMAPRTRQVFTAAHELGHFYLHDQKSTETLYRRELPKFDSDDKELEEQEADWFASCLLMPRDILHYLFVVGVQIEHIANQFGVPATVAFYRLKHLGLLLQ